MSTKALKLGILLLFSINNGYAITQSAGDVVKKTANEVIDRLTAQRAELDEHPERIYDLIHEVVIPHFDFLSMSKWVLGKKNWGSASEVQRNSFVDEFRTLLVRTYAKALLEYSDESIIYHDTENNPESNIAVVKTEIQQSGANNVPINYSMHVTGGEWKVIDVAVDGVSLVRTYRGSFASEIRKNGMDALILKLSQRNAELTNKITQK